MEHAHTQTHMPHANKTPLNHSSFAYTLSRGEKDGAIVVGETTRKEAQSHLLKARGLDG